MHGDFKLIALGRASVCYLWEAILHRGECVAFHGINLQLPKDRSGEEEVSAEDETLHGRVHGVYPAAGDHERLPWKYVECVQLPRGHSIAEEMLALCRRRKQMWVVEVGARFGQAWSCLVRCLVSGLWFVVLMVTDLFCFQGPSFLSRSVKVYFYWFTWSGRRTHFI